MQDREQAVVFDEERASTYDERFTKLAPLRDTLHLLTRLILAELPIDARIQQRRNFFSQIAARLRPQAYLISADLASDLSTSSYQSLREIWTQMLKYAEYPEQTIEDFLAAHGRDAAVLPPPEVAAIIESAGFDRAVLFMQTLFIHAWYARRL
jgi:tRNA (cmo5U34)-methyltransferase